MKRTYVLASALIVTFGLVGVSAPAHAADRYINVNATGTVTGTPVLQQICSTVISEGGYEQVSQQYVARLPTALSLTTSGTFYPLVSIRLNSSYLGALPKNES